MGFVVWFEPERVWRGTYIAQDGMILVFRRQMQRYIQQKAAVETDSTLRQSGSDGPDSRPEWLSCTEYDSPESQKLKMTRSGRRRGRRHS